MAAEIEGLVLIVLTELLPELHQRYWGNTAATLDLLN